MTHLRNSLLCIFLALSSLCAYQAYLVLVAAESAIATTEQRVERVTTTADRVLLSIGGTAAILRNAAQEQTRLTAETTKRTNAVLTQAETSLRNFDERVNGQDGLIVAATSAIRQQNENATVILRDIAFSARLAQGDVHEMAGELKPALAALAETSEGLAKIANDPAIGETMKHTAGTMENVEGITENLKKATKPAKLWLKGIQWAWDNVVKGFIVF